MCFKVPFEDLDTAFKKIINDQCTIRTKPTEYNPTPHTYYCFRVNDDTKEISVPMFLWSELYETPPNDDYKYPPCNTLEFRGTLYTKASDPRKFRDQKEVAREALAILNERRTVFLSLATGYGKTLTAIYLGTVLKLKTLVLCHFREVIQQWCEAYAQHTGAVVVNFNVTKKTRYRDADVYVGGIQRCIKLLQTPAGRKIFDGIGLVVIDEAHVLTAATFAECLPLLPPPKFLIGLTATPDRPDKLDQLYFPYFGSPTNYIVRTQIKQFLVVKFVSRFKPVVEYTVIRGKPRLDWTKAMNSLAYNPERNDLIADLARAYPERKILVLCSRVEQAVSIHHNLVESGESVDTYYGRMRTYNKDARILVAGAKKVGVGFNNEAFTMLILAFDAKDVRQMEGRIRADNNIVLDIVDDNSTWEKHWKLRQKWYTQRGASFKTIQKPPPVEISRSQKLSCDE